MKKTGFFLFFLLITRISIAQTSADIFQQIKKLNVLGSVLYFAAHPDDENNTLLPFLAKEKLYRTGYLSLTRGDGGQNLIGSEQGIELGLIRTQELIAARKIDGGEQYFTSAYEFGYSKSATEALRIWDKEKVLADAVWIIRKFQPDIIIKRFPPDARAGHGHHAASAIIADEAFIAAGDPERFPEQLKYGLKPWKAKRILWNTFNFGNTNTTSDNQLKIDIGLFNSLLGKSYGEIGGEARTMHKSQGEGRPRRKGSITDYFITTGGDTAKSALMENIDVSWSRIKGADGFTKSINEIINSYSFEFPERSVPLLVKLYKQMQSLDPSVWRDKKMSDLQEIIEQCSGLFIEATTTQEKIIKGDSLKTTFFLNNRKAVPVTLKKIQLEDIDSTLNLPLLKNQNVSFTKLLSVHSGKQISQPYWLEEPVMKGMFNVKNQSIIGNAENEPAFKAIFTLEIEGEIFRFTKPVMFKTVDPVRGEIYQPIAVFPQQEVQFDKENYLILNNKPVTATIITKSSNNNIVNAQSKSMLITNDGMLPNSSKLITELNSVSSQTITYDHIPTQTYFKTATANVVNLDIKLKGKKIGYVVGAGDKIPEALEGLGYSVSIISEKEVTEANLKQFDAVITGIRAYNIHQWLNDKNAVLNKYVEEGGNLIVQYLKSNTVGLNRVKVGPYPFAVNAQSRVTEEDAQVQFLIPKHPVLNYPNKITAKDFEGWVQERSTYQAEQLDSKYETILAMNDTGEKQSNGSLIIAKHGKGNFAYVSLVLFRQLPAGVSGSYRLLANLIALPKNK